MGNHWVTLIREAHSSKKLRDTDWTKRTFSGPTIVDDIPDGRSTCGNNVNGERFKVVVNAMPLAVQIAAREWDTELDLQNLVEDACQKVGMKKAFKGVMKGIRLWICQCK